MKTETMNLENELKAAYSNEINSEVTAILNAHGLDFRIEKLAAFSEYNGQRIDSDYYHLYNTKSKEIIHSAKGSYTISQNDDVVRAVLMGMKPFGDKLNVTKAGALDGGRRTFIQLGIEGFGKVGDDNIKQYVTIIDSNDGSTGLSVGIGNLTMSCQNQFFKFYKAGQSKFMHTASILQRIQELPSLISLALSETMEMIGIYGKLRSTAASRELVDAMVKELVGIDRKSVNTEKDSSRLVNSMNNLYFHMNKEIAQKGMNAWGVFSGVTSWTTHAKSHPKRENGQIESLMVGTNYNTNQKALKFAMAI